MSTIAAGTTTTTALVSTGDTTGALVLQTNGTTTAVTIDTSQNVGVGVTPSGNFLLQAGNFATNAARSFKLMALYGGISGGGYPQVGYNFRSTTTTSSYIYDVSDIASAINFQDGFLFNIAASGTAGNAITFTQALALEKDKSLALQGATPQTGTGITFPATQSASTNANTLDDYEEGTWTPEMSFGNDTTGITYSTQVGTYEKIGRQVTLRCQVTFTNNGSGSGIAKLSGFPFTLLAGSNAAAAFSIFTDVTLSGTYYASAVPQGSSTFAYFRMSDAYMTETQFTNTANFTFMTSYNV
jgi:hypothetical protein